MESFALVAQWIEQTRPKGEMGVRFPSEAQKCEDGNLRCRPALSDPELGEGESKGSTVSARIRQLAKKEDSYRGRQNSLKRLNLFWTKKGCDRVSPGGWGEVVGDCGW